MKNGSIIYFCSRTSEPNDDIEVFAKPTALRLRPNYLTIQPASGYLDIQTFGEFVDITQKGIATPYTQWDGFFKEGDRLYLNKKPDGLRTNKEPEEGWGYDADAKIISVKPQNKAIALTIRTIVK